jgi:hypothetical protein
MRSRFLLIPAAIVAAAPAAQAVDLQTLEAAQEKLFPGVKLTPADFTLSRDDFESLKSEYNVPSFRAAVKAWRAPNGDYLYLDQVYGLNDIVTYVVAISADGHVKGIEVLVCADGFCEMYTPEWRASFAGKTHGKWEPSQAVPMVSGCTLSSVHVAEGVKKILAIHARYLPKA